MRIKSLQMCNVRPIILDAIGDIRTAISYIESQPEYAECYLESAIEKLFFSEEQNAGQATEQNKVAVEP